jgi:hypothetical protein
MSGHISVVIVRATLRLRAGRPRTAGI